MKISHEKTTTITDKSIDSTGIPLDYKNALAELIWNSFDVSMTSVDIQLQAKTKNLKSQILAN